MKKTSLMSVAMATIIVLLVVVPTRASAQSIIDADFAKGDFAALGWKAQGDWDVFRYPGEITNNPGPLARFAAHKPAGSLTKSFPELKNPKHLSLSLDYGWGWGDAGQAADAVSFMLQNANRDGYIFEVHRVKAKWAVQWAKVAKGEPPKDKTWAVEEIDATHASVRAGGGLSRLTITRASDGAWTIVGHDWNKGAGTTVRFTDATTTSFSQLVLLGTPNFDDQVFNKIVLAVSSDAATTDAAAVPVVAVSSDAATTDAAAVPVADFLGSIGVVTSFPDRGQPLSKTIEMVKYTGFRWVRGWIEGLKPNGPTTVQTYLDLHKETGVKFSWGLASGGTNLKLLIETARQLAAADALLAFEGNNEPNNWGVTYQNEKGGGKAPSWLAVAKLQRDFRTSPSRMIPS